MPDKAAGITGRDHQPGHPVPKLSCLGRAPDEQPPGHGVADTRVEYPGRRHRHHQGPSAAGFHRDGPRIPAGCRFHAAVRASFVPQKYRRTRVDQQRGAGTLQEGGC